MRIKDDYAETDHLRQQRLQTKFRLVRHGDGKHPRKRLSADYSRRAGFDILRKVSKMARV